MNEAISTIGEKLTLRRFTLKQKLITIHSVSIYTWVDVLVY